jgi:hypothetical protein
MQYIGTIEVAIAATQSNESTLTPFAIPAGVSNLWFYSTDAATVYEFEVGHRLGHQMTAGLGVPVAAGANNIQKVPVNPQAKRLVLSVRATVANTNIRVFADTERLGAT